MFGKKKTFNLPVDIAIGVIEKVKTNRSNIERYNITVYMIDSDYHLISDTNNFCTDKELYATMILISDFYYHLHDKKVLFTDTLRI